MININSLRIDSIGENIILDMETAVSENFTKLLAWNDDGYDDPSKAFDLTPLLDGSTNEETITINAETYLETKFLHGAWYFEVTSSEDSDNKYIAVAANLYTLYECLLRKVSELRIDKCQPVLDMECDSCEGNVFYMDALLSSAGKMLEFGLYHEAANAINELEVLCEICPTCPDFDGSVIANGSGYATVDNQVIVV